jgi:muconolactone D-isomerase
MLFLTQVQVLLPRDVPADTLEKLLEQERARSQELQRDGKLLHLWRVAGRRENVSVWDVGSIDELHEILSRLPMYPFLDITLTPLARHPSALSGPAQATPPA